MAVLSWLVNERQDVPIAWVSAEREKTSGRLAGARLLSGKERLMPTIKASTVSRAGVAITLLALPLWIAIIYGLTNSYGGGAIGHGGDSGLLTYALTGLLTAVGIVILWVLLALVLIIAGMKGAMPRLAMLVAVVLIPASGVAAIYAQDLLAMPPNQSFSLPSSPPWPLSPFLWPLVVPALVPPLVVGFSFWAMTPSLHARIPARLASGVVWGLVLVLSLSLFPMTQMRQRAHEEFYAPRNKRHADLFALPANSRGDDADGIRRSQRNAGYRRWKSISSRLTASGRSYWIQWPPSGTMVICTSGRASRQACARAARDGIGSLSSAPQII